MIYFMQRLNKKKNQNKSPKSDLNGFNYVFGRVI